LFNICLGALLGHRVPEVVCFKIW